MKKRLPGWLYSTLYYGAPVAIALVILTAVLFGIIVALRQYEETVPPRPRIEVLATDDVRCVVVYGEAVTCQWLETGASE